VDRGLELDRRQMVELDGRQDVEVKVDAGLEVNAGQELELEVDARPEVNSLQELEVDGGWRVCDGRHTPPVTQKHLQTSNVLLTKGAYAMCLTVNPKDNISKSKVWSGQPSDFSESGRPRRAFKLLVFFTTLKDPTAY
jgi:hypothetical protein